MSNRDSLSDRMKGYENRYRVYLPNRLPVIIRIDGKAFHNFTKDFERPFDDRFATCMQKTALGLCQQIEGAKLAYYQSDEISILLTNNDTIKTKPWFDNNLQKLTSVAASMATLYFNRNWGNIVDDYCEFYESWSMFGAPYDENGEEKRALYQAYNRANYMGALFDARAFILPEDEVANYFIWRQQDAIRNSIQMVAQSVFSHNELQGLNNDNLQNKLLTEKNIDWNNYPTYYKHGACILKKNTKIMVNINPNRNCEPKFEEQEREMWSVDWETPIFSKERSYIEKVLPR